MKNLHILDISEGSDFEIYNDDVLIATCGTKEMAERLVRLLNGTEEL